MLESVGLLDLITFLGMSTFIIFTYPTSSLGYLVQCTGSSNTAATKKQLLSPSENK